VGSEVNNF